MNLNPRLGLAAAALLIAGAGGAALAHPHPDGDGDKKVKRFVIVEDGKHGEHHAKGKRVRRVEIIRDGEHHAGRGPRVRHFEMHGDGALVDCEGGEKVVEEGAERDGKKTKVVICTRGDRPTAATAERIEKALARIRANDELSDEQKARIETALRSAMERVRSTR
jgi:hypothetical protein